MKKENITNRILKYLKNPRRVFLYLVERYPHLFKEDKTYLKLKWYFQTGSPLNLTNPVTFNEKLNWMKLHFHDEKMPIMADKYEAKKYVASLIGQEYVVLCYGVWNSFDEIEFDSLPEKFVLKATSDSSGATICRDIRTFERGKAKVKFEACLHRNYYWDHREWGYKNITPRILADEFLDDKSGHELTDYKFWCFNGEPQYMYCTNKGDNIYENFYDMDFQPVDINHGYPRRQPEFERPKAFEKMKELAAKLSKGFPFIRIDFFYVNEKIYFGEFTFYDWAGLKPFATREMDEKLGKLIILPQ